VFTKNRDRLLTTDVARKVLAAILAHREVAPLLSDEHFSVDGTLVKAWASMKSFQPKPEAAPPGWRQAGRPAARRRRCRCRPPPPMPMPKPLPKPAPMTAPMTALRIPGDMATCSDTIWPCIPEDVATFEVPQLSGGLLVSVGRRFVIGFRLGFAQ